MESKEASEWNKSIKDILDAARNEALSIGRVLSAQTYLRLENHSLGKKITDYCYKYGLCDRETIDFMGVLEIEVESKRANRNNRKAIICYCPTLLNKEWELPEFAFILNAKSDGRVLIERCTTRREFWKDFDLNMR